MCGLRTEHFFDPRTDSKSLAHVNMRTRTEADPAFLKFKAVFDGGSGGFDPPQELADTPPESSAKPLWGVDSNPPKNLPIPFSC